MAATTRTPFSTLFHDHDCFASRYDIYQSYSYVDYTLCMPFMLMIGARCQTEVQSRTPNSALCLFGDAIANLGELDHRL